MTSRDARAGAPCTPLCSADSAVRRRLFGDIHHGDGASGHHAPSIAVIRLHVSVQLAVVSSWSAAATMMSSLAA